VDHLADAVVVMAKVQLARDLSAGQVEDIMAFLRSLTGKMPESIMKAPVLPAED
jgi:cytochrome c peroxidase